MDTREVSSTAGVRPADDRPPRQTPKRKRKTAAPASPPVSPPASQAPARSEGNDGPRGLDVLA